MAMIVVVQRLSIDRSDDGEGELVVVLESGLRYGCGHVRLAQARTNQLHSGDVHVGCHVASLLDLGDLLVALIDTLVHDTHNERYGGFLRSRNHA